VKPLWNSAQKNYFASVQQIANTTLPEPPVSLNTLEGVIRAALCLTLAVARRKSRE
jgi:hypothetical protein